MLQVVLKWIVSYFNCLMKALKISAADNARHDDSIAGKKKREAPNRNPSTGLKNG
jgi:hypothetical protein